MLNKLILSSLLVLVALMLTAKPMQRPLTISYIQVLDKIRHGDRDVIRFITYHNLIEISEYIRLKAEEKKKTFVYILLNKDPKEWSIGATRAFAAGLFNKDPRVRLYSAHILLKFSAKRSWFEKDVQRSLDRRGFHAETVDKVKYSYTNMYGRIHSENLIDSLNRLLALGNEIVLIRPEPNFKSYQKVLAFEWATVYGAVSYDFYIDDNLLYRGPFTIVDVRSIDIYRTQYGAHKWLVVAKNLWDEILTSNEAQFYVKELERPHLRLDSGYLNRNLKFRWRRSSGAGSYALYVKKRGIRKSILLFRTQKKRAYTLTKSLSSGRFYFYLEVKNFFQKRLGNVIILDVSSRNGKMVIRRVNPPSKYRKKANDEETDFDIDDFKDIEKENQAELEAEEEGDDDEAGDDEVGDDEVGDDEVGDDEVGDDEVGDDEVGDDE
ncbi:MAG TPA: hypothetical protein ENI73_07480, partial [Spirochaetes bacterium]|nr:hypothetical protein [Spirochaetota bacterium]